MAHMQQAVTKQKLRRERNIVMTPTIRASEISKLLARLETAQNALRAIKWFDTSSQTAWESAFTARSEIAFCIGYLEVFVKADDTAPVIAETVEEPKSADMLISGLGLT